MRTRSASFTKGYEPQGDVAEPVGRVLVGDAEAMMAGRRDTGESEGLPRLGPARRRIGCRIREPVPAGVVSVSRGAIGDMHHRDVVEARQQDAAAENLVVGMRQDDKWASRGRRG